MLKKNIVRTYIYVGLEILLGALLLVAIVQAFRSGDVEPVEKTLLLGSLLGFDLARRYVPAADEE